MGDCSSSLFVCPSGCNWPGHRKLFTTILCLPVENAKGRLWSCKGDSAEGIGLLWAVVPAAFLYAWAVAIGLGTGSCFPLFYACLWKTQRETLWSCKRDSAEGIRLLWTIVPAVFLYARVLAIGLGTGIHFPLLLARLWKTQRKDCDLANGNNVEEIRLLWAVVPAAFLYAWAVAIGPGAGTCLSLFWPVCGKRKGNTRYERAKPVCPL